MQILWWELSPKVTTVKELLAIGYATNPSWTIYSIEKCYSRIKLYDGLTTQKYGNLGLV